MNELPEKPQNNSFISLEDLLGKPPEDLNSDEIQNKFRRNSLLLPKVILYELGHTYLPDPNRDSLIESGNIFEIFEKRNIIYILPSQTILGQDSRLLIASSENFTQNSREILVQEVLDTELISRLQGLIDIYRQAKIGIVGRKMKDLFPNLIKPKLDSSMHFFRGLLSNKIKDQAANGNLPNYHSIIGSTLSE
jgi:hypothetical protein